MCCDWLRATDTPIKTKRFEFTTIHVVTPLVSTERKCHICDIIVLNMWRLMQSMCISGTCNISNLVELKRSTVATKTHWRHNHSHSFQQKKLLVKYRKIRGTVCEGVYKRLTNIALTSVCGEATN